jgi:Zn-dependent protease with chaperone function
MLRPSRLPAARQAQLQARFAELVARMDPAQAPYRGYLPPLVLVFRDGLGANALALPGGTLVLTDGLVQAAGVQGLPDDALVGVLAHEIGHVMHRHATRIVVEQGVLNIGLGVALGDVSMVLSTGASVLTGLAYQRGHEAEADCFALRLMQRAGLPTAPMADLLAGIDRPGGGDRASGVAALLATHPDTLQRARRLREGRAEGCA